METSSSPSHLSHLAYPELISLFGSDLPTSHNDSEVIERWFRLFSPRGSDRKPMKVSKELVAARLGDAEWVSASLHADIYDSDGEKRT